MYDDLDRPPLRPGPLARALAPDGWRVEVLAETGSTNEVVTQRARAGEPAGLVVVAESQTAGRGRLDRTWVSPPRAGLTVSVLMRPDLTPAQWPWLPLLTGLAVATALAEQAEVDAVLKWPNDVLVGGRKVCGVLVEVPEQGAAVLGIGLNISTRADELPHDAATSLRQEGAATTDRGTLLRATLRALTVLMGDVEAAQQAYRERCSTIGAQVRIELPTGAAVVGTAQAVDDTGRIVVDGTAYDVGDLVHLRPVSG